MTRQEKIDKIYEVIARKDLTLGCKIDLGNDEYKLFQGIYTVYNEDETQIYTCEETCGIWHSDYPLMNIIGHPVMIGDVLDWIEVNLSKDMRKCPDCGGKIEYDAGQEPSHPETGQRDIEPSHYCSSGCDWNSLYDEEREDGDPGFPPIRELIGEGGWNKYRKPIEDQSELCIDFIYGLVVNE